MSQRAPRHSPAIFVAGSQVVTNRPIRASSGRTLHPAGAVGVVVKTPASPQHSYRVRFPDGFEAVLHHDELVLLADYKRKSTSDGRARTSHDDLFQRVIFRCVIGSRAYGLHDAASDTDRRGIYLPPADSHWSLYGVPEQIENEATQEAYWEIQKFIVLALKANPNVLECLYTPIVEKATPLACELLGLKHIFLSRLVYQTFNGYAMSQFKKIQSSIRNRGEIKWKHVMHLIRLLLAGLTVLREGFVPVLVEEHRDMLLAIKTGQVPWSELDAWRRDLHRQFDEAFEKSRLPARPDYERANQFLVKARRLALSEDLP